MKYVEVPLAGGSVLIDVRNRSVDLVLCVEDGSRTVRVSLYGVTADHLVRKVAGALPAMRQDVLEEFTEWVRE